MYIIAEQTISLGFVNQEIDIISSVFEKIVKEKGIGLINNIDFSKDEIKLVKALLEGIENKPQENGEEINK